MSKYSDELCETFPNVRDVKKRTKEVLDRGEDLAFKEIHDAGSVDRLKKEIRKK